MGACRNGPSPCSGTNGRATIGVSAEPALLARFTIGDGGATTGASFTSPPSPTAPSVVAGFGLAGGGLAASWPASDVGAAGALDSCVGAAGGVSGCGASGSVAWACAGPWAVVVAVGAGFWV